MIHYTDLYFRSAFSSPKPSTRSQIYYLVDFAPAALPENKIEIGIKPQFAATYLIATGKEIKTATLSHNLIDIYSIVSTESFSGDRFSTQATPYFRIRAVKIKRLRAEYLPSLYVDKVSLGIPSSTEYTVYFCKVIEVPLSSKMEEARKSVNSEQSM